MYSHLLLGSILQQGLQVLVLTDVCVLFFYVNLEEKDVF